MAYKKFKNMLEDLSCEELEFENGKIHERKNKEEDLLMIGKMKEKGCLFKEHQKNEKCSCCNLLFEDCPIKDEVIKWSRENA